MSTFGTSVIVSNANVRRSNPCTLSFYPPGLDVDANWLKQDQTWRKTLPDIWAIRRMAYRAALVQAGRSLRIIDAVKLGDREKMMNEGLIRRLGMSATSLGLKDFESLLSH